jgi:RHS repeat-associated protein
VRLSYDKNLAIVEENNYYPFGLKQKGYNSTPSNYLYRSPQAEKYKYNGKELQDELGLNMYDYGARNYDPAIGRWMNIDPLAEKYPGVNPYAYCLNNPIRFVDLDGQEPTPYEAALMAAHVYGDSKIKLEGGWEVSSAGKGIEYTNDKIGFKSALYERTVDGKTEYTYATAGTEASWNDVGADIKQPLGLSKQYDESMKNARDLKNILPKGAELTFTGHSLGGGEAEANSSTTGDKAITFNAAGVSPLTTGTLKKPNAIAFIMTTDPLNAIQQSSPILPSAGGRKQFVAPRSFSGWYDGHSINSMIESLKTIKNGGGTKIIENLSTRWSDLFN